MLTVELANNHTCLQARICRELCVVYWGGGVKTPPLAQFFLFFVLFSSSSFLLACLSRVVGNEQGYTPIYPVSGKLTPFFSGRNRICRSPNALTQPPPPYSRLSTLFSTGAASRPASNCTTPSLK